MQCIFGFLILVIISLLFIDKSQSTPLDDYVHAPDPHFNWTVIQTYDQPDYKLYILNFTSQKWFDGKLIWWNVLNDWFSNIETFSNRPIWWHYLCISIPHKFTRPNSAFMLIDGGSNNNGYEKIWIKIKTNLFDYRLPTPQDNFVSLTSMFAVSSGSIGVDLQDIPNEPIRFVVRLLFCLDKYLIDLLIGWSNK